MNAWTRLIILVITITHAVLVTADTRIVQQSHQDSFTVMGHTQPAQDTERVLWIGDKKLAMVEGDTGFIVRADKEKLYIIDHVQKTVSHVAIPVDISQLLPPGTAEQMLPLLSFDVEVTPTDETKTVGQWTARRYDVTMTSKMAKVENTVWATQDVDVDWNEFRRLFHYIVSLQPGAHDMMEKLATIDGLTVEETTITKMRMTGDTGMKSHDLTVSVESMDPPPGTYDPPAGYNEREFDLLSAMSGK